MIIEQQDMQRRTSEPYRSRTIRSGSTTGLGTPHLKKIYLLAAHVNIKLLTINSPSTSKDMINTLAFAPALRVPSSLYYMFDYTSYFVTVGLSNTVQLRLLGNCSVMLELLESLLCCLARHFFFLLIVFLFPSRM